MTITITIEEKIPGTDITVREEAAIHPSAVYESPSYFLHQAILATKQSVEAKVRAVTERQRAKNLLPPVPPSPPLSISPSL